MNYYAKSANREGKQQTVKEHLSSVAALAEQFGAEFGLETPASLAGILHDFGKYSQSFQKVLEGTMHGVDHASAGAMYLESIVKGKGGNNGRQTVVAPHAGRVD